VLAAAASTLAAAQTWRVTASASWESTLTDNVNLSADDQRKADWVNQLTPSVRFAETSAHTRFAGSIALPILLYARTSENNYVAPEVAISGTVEALDRFFFVDTTVNVSQQYRSPFGAVPNSLTNATTNRYTAQSYTVSPYIRGLLPNNVEYLLRDTNSWAVANGAGNGLGNSYANHLNGFITAQAAPFGWSGEYDRTYLTSDTQATEKTSIVRALALYRPDVTLQLSAIVGYEDNQFVLTQERGVTYGVGGTWHPTERTNANGRWEHRFFGSSYRVDFDHRTPLTVWSIHASRDITNYPTQLANLPVGGNVPGLLNDLLLSKVPDAAQRQQLVDQIIRERGLPTLLQGPVILSAEQITLVETETASFGILGARNSILFTVFRSRNQPVPGSDLAAVSDVLTTVTDSTQVGTGVVWTHQLASDMTWATNLTVARAKSNQEPRETTDQYLLSSTVSRSLSPFTSIYGGARFQDSRSEVAQGFREFAVFFGLTYTFH
jgi:uncharacterized protein (PEP-CTERM system associated)